MPHMLDGPKSKASVVREWTSMCVWFDAPSSSVERSKYVRDRIEVASCFYTQISNQWANNVDSALEEFKSFMSNNKTFLNAESPEAAADAAWGMLKRLRDAKAEWKDICVFAESNVTEITRCKAECSTLVPSRSLVERAAELSRADEEVCAAARSAGVLRRAKRSLSIGTFDLFHRGHANLLRVMRDMGEEVWVGVHDDISYEQLKGRPPADPLSVRMEQCKKYADVVFAVVGTDPTFFLNAVVPAIKSDDFKSDEPHWVYVRGDDMPAFPGCAWAQQRMEVRLIPRTPCISTTLLKMNGGSGK